ARDPQSLASDSLRAVLVDARGRIWVGTTETGVDTLDPATGRFEHLQRAGSKAGSLGSDRVRALAHGHGGSIWIGTEAGLDRWSPGTRTLEPFGMALRGTAVASVLEDRSGAVWAGTFDTGVTRLASDGHVLETFHHDPARPTSLASNEVRAILEDNSG